MPFHLGTGSWADPEYRRLLVAPPGVPASQRLAAYASAFAHVEVNATYHRLPSSRQTAEWVKQTPPGFTFSCKLHRLFAQNPEKAADDPTLIQRTLAGLAPLMEANRLTCFLLVLPPRFTRNRHDLAELNPLIAALAPHPLAVEVRHSSWTEGAQFDETVAAFRERGLIWVGVDMPRIPGSDLLPPVDAVTRPGIAYLRLHGRNPDWPQGSSAEEKHTYLYPPDELTEIAQRARQLAKQAEHVYVIANNHARDYAPRTALQLKQLLTPDQR